MEVISSLHPHQCNLRPTRNKQTLQLIIPQVINKIDPQFSHISPKFICIVLFQSVKHHQEEVDKAVVVVAAAGAKWIKLINKDVVEVW